MRSGKVLVYAGKGSSHSWVWMADLLESGAVFDAEFVDARRLVSALKEDSSLVVISGGDGFEIASSLSVHGFAAIEEHVRGGGRYFGACAGAYLPLPSRFEPLDRFNLSTTRIRNLAPARDESLESSPRTGVRYGSCSIVHPVRGDVVVADGPRSFTAPIFGGPVFREPESDLVLLRYSSFTEKTSFQVERCRAEAMMLGAPAVVSSRVDDGTMILAGPHLEHPGYPEANSVFIDLSGVRRGKVNGTCVRARRPDGSVDRSLADLKVAIMGMERESFLIGAKLWDGGRLLELVQAIDKRKDSIDRDTAQAIASLLDDAREDLLAQGPHRVADSDSAPAKLIEAARLCVNSYFKTMKG
jgi:glutamine amidotransferase-like uncharacterized protein